MDNVVAKNHLKKGAVESIKNYIEFICNKYTSDSPGAIDKDELHREIIHELLKENLIKEVTQ